MFNENATPAQAQGVEVDDLSETPTPDEFFLYSRIDGETTVGELCSTSGLGRDATLEALERLFELGLIDIPGASRSTLEGEGDETSSQASGGQETRDSDSSDDDSSESPDPTTELDLTHLPVSPREYEFDEDLLEYELPLEETKRRELLCLHGQLDDLDYYQFFGVDRDASVREIKQAYFKLSKRYHPDHYFKDDLGPFAEIIETVFQQITRGHRILSDPDKRREYDRDLEDPVHGGEDEDNEDPTPMNQPSSIDLARESSSYAEHDDSDEPATDANKRQAAFHVLVQRGDKAREEGHIVQAARHFRKALRIQRDVEVAIRAADMLLEADLRLEQAELFARAALRIDEDHPDAHLMMARIFDRLDRRERALEHYEQVLEIEDHEEAERERDQLLRSS